MSCVTYVGPLLVSAACSLPLSGESARIRHKERCELRLGGAWLRSHQAGMSGKIPLPTPDVPSFDGGEHNAYLPLKKARAGQRAWIGPTNLSRDREHACRRQEEARASTDLAVSGR
jgi:hypothetical protein